MKCRSFLWELVRFILHFLLLAFFMLIPDHWMRTHYETVDWYVPYLFNAGGAVTYLLFLRVIRWLYPDLRSIL